jgi:hypothetical protein
MGFLLTILYLITNYLTPATLFGPLASAHIELILAVVVGTVSIIPLARSFVLKTPQSLALGGLGLAVMLSVVFGMRWVGGALPALLRFMPNAFAYFLVCLHCNSIRRLQILVFMLLFVCLFVITRGSIELRHQTAVSEDEVTESPYVLAMSNDAGQWFYRLRGLGEINDPNDFGQLIVAVIPLVFVFWQPKKKLRNFIRVILPVGALLFGLFLTHSRGALLALVSIALIAARRRIGTAPAIVLAVALFVAAMTLNFTGGREISADAGSDRTALWGESLQLLKSHPLFGVGFQNLDDYMELTAHNSVAVCAAELGLFGFYFWCMFLFSTVRGAWILSLPANLSEGRPVQPEQGLYPLQTQEVEQIDKEQIGGLGSLLTLALSGFLVSGWFLSRAFVLTFFLLGGMAEVVFQMALKRGVIASTLRLDRVLLYTSGLAFALLLAMYVLLRIVNLIH